MRKGAMMAKRIDEGEEPDFSTWVPSKHIPGTLFRMIRAAEEGGHGRLYQVEHEITGRVCALKAIHRRHKNLGELTERLKQEANVNTRLSGHPNIAEVYDAGVTGDGRTYVLMQWLEGASLRNVMKNGTGLNVHVICFIIKSVLSALDRAHGLDIVHRDIKPENIFLCDDGLVKLIDFGIAKVLKSKFVQTGPGMTPGTFRYMSPEAVAGETPTLASWDIYSLGVVFWEMIAGEHPFLQSLPKDIAHAIVHEGVLPLDAMPKAVATAPEALRRVVMRACARDAAERFFSAAAFAEAIDGAMGYAPSPQPLAAGIHPPPHGGVEQALNASSAYRVQSAPSPRAAPSERSPGTALEALLAPTPRVELTDQAARPQAVIDPRSVAGQGKAPASSGMHRSSVLVRGQRLHSSQMPPRAPWLATPPNTTSEPAGSGAEFGVLSHIPAFEREADQDAIAEQIPNSTPPLVSGTSLKEDAANHEVSGEAALSPRHEATAAGKRWWGRALLGGRAQERLRTIAGRPLYVALIAASAVALAVVSFAVGRIWETPRGLGAPAWAEPEAGKETPRQAPTQLRQAALADISARAALDVAPPAPPTSAPPSAHEATPPAPSAAAKATTSAALGAPAKRGAASEPKRDWPRRDGQERGARRPSSSPPQLPKGGIEPGF